MPLSPRVLVVGTTPDYIDWIRRSRPGRVLFITDPGARRRAQEPSPPPAEEILCELSDYRRVGDALEAHLERGKLRLTGVAAFDCESLELAAGLAREFALPHPSVRAVRSCRDKFVSKALWEQLGLHCPKSRLIRSADDAVRFHLELGRPCVLKPLSGSGSELVFRCDDARACESGFQAIAEGLGQRRSNRLFQPLTPEAPEILAEEWVGGEEFSCDFMVADGRTKIIRLTRKIVSTDGPFGTARGYFLSTGIPDEVPPIELHQTLYRSAAALGLDRAVCMLDFKVHQGRIFLLELAPRPGGDCLPYLLRCCWGLDMLGLYLDFCEQRPVDFTPPADARPCLGLRLHARQAGILKKIEARRLAQDPRVREIHLTRKHGDRVLMPPDDYDSWLLGHVIFEPHAGVELAAQCRVLGEKLVVEMEENR